MERALKNEFIEIKMSEIEVRMKLGGAKQARKHPFFRGLGQFQQGLGRECVFGT